MADVKTRQAYFGKLQRLEVIVNAINTDTATAGQIQANLKLADDYMKRIEDSHLRIVHSLTDDDAIQLQETIVKPMEEKYQLILATLLDYKLSIGSSRTTQSLRLPDIQLPTFDGKYEDWPSFEDLFNATVEKNSTLSLSQKLQYLKTCTKGEAATVIKSFTVTDCNYRPAWTLLKQRYSNTREIVQSLIKKLVQQPHMKSESANQLQTLLNTTLECIQSLKVMGRPTDWDDLIIFIIVEKMDGETRSEWAKSLRNSDPSTFSELQQFMENHIRTLHAQGTVKQQHTSSNSNGRQQRHISTHHSTQVNIPSQCQVCTGPHQLYHCSKLKEMQPDKRFATVKSTGVCLNCLKTGHSVKTCSSNYNCRKCGRKHNTLVHIDNQNSQVKNGQSTYSNNSSSGNNSTVNNAQSNTNEQQSLRINHQAAFPSSSSTLLKTALVDVKDSNNVKHQLRVMLDDGGEGGLINEKVMNRLGLQKQKVNVSIYGVGSVKSSQAKWKTSIRLYSQINNSFFDVELFAVPRVSGHINRVETGDPKQWTHLQGIQLADPYYLEGGEVDILLGSDTVPYLIEDGLKRVDRSMPAAQNTIFGWVVFGNAKSISPGIIRTHQFSCELSNILRKFWEMEEVPGKQALTQEEEYCEKYFLSTHQKQHDGRYIVRLPFNNNKDKIGSTRPQALSRLHQLERRFRKYPQHKEDYIKFMREYLSLNHMEKVTVNSAASYEPVYIPHHFVLKEDSTTTKLRVVFDGSAKSSTGISLNDILKVGPTVQPDLFTIIIRFRLHPIALKGDMEKMYRQFRVHEEDCNYQRILWREDPSLQVEEYRLLTLTYGTGPAAYLATRSLNLLATDQMENYPSAANAILTSTYVDDFLNSQKSRKEAVKLVQDIISIMAAAQIKIRKWCSNDLAVLASLPSELREEEADLNFDDNQHGSIKALGIRWQPPTDCFKFKVITNCQDKVTKRHMLSEIAKTFDPLGWLAPVTVNAKLLLQKLWLQNLDWDVEISGDMKEEWNKYQQDLLLVENISVPRCIIKEEALSYELHGYCDSSELAFSSCVYMKCIYINGSVSVSLIAARTKVAPLKAVSLPKLELSGAKLLAETIDAVQKAIQLPHQLYCWTDSTITLRWISSHSRRWKTFVANRVSVIQSLVAPEHWHHVRSAENPADLPSRGISASQLKDSTLWWHGPAWLLQPTYPISFQPCDEEEMKKEERTKQLTVFNLALNTAHDSLFNAFSSFTKLCRATAYIIKFINFKKTKGTVSLLLTAGEINSAKQRLIRWSQQVSFSQEMHDLERNGKVSSSSKLLLLNPFIDSEGLMRVGGRIHNAQLPANSKHPVILCSKHQLTKLIINKVHLENLHSGFTLTHATIRRYYWIVQGRDVIRHFIRKCVVCRRARAALSEQLMGSLPVGRVTPALRAFLHSGVDFAGPFPVKLRKGRHVPCEKAYFAIYVCLTTKAIHLESVNKLTTEDFIACFERFIARRGKPAHLYSDCGTNFVGADRILQQYLQSEQGRIQSHVANEGTHWHFNPPSAPHQGGLWEAGVKSVKFHFKRVVGSSILMLDQFQTLLCKIEACLNSRPLCALSSDPTDLDALTPGHFLIGGPITSVPEPDCTMINENRLTYWEQVRKINQHFWNRWTTEYLTSLQQRFKWTQKRDNLQVGDLVVIKDELLPATKWKLGRIISTHPGKDNLVRTVTVRTATGEYTRLIAKLSPLILQNEM